MTFKLIKIFYFILIIFSFSWSQQSSLITHKIAVENSYRDKVASAISRLVGIENVIVIVNVEMIDEIPLEAVCGKVHVCEKKGMCISADLHGQCKGCECNDHCIDKISEEKKVNGNPKALKERNDVEVLPKFENSNDICIYNTR